MDRMERVVNIRAHAHELNAQTRLLLTASESESKPKMCCVLQASVFTLMTIIALLQLQTLGKITSRLASYQVSRLGGANHAKRRQQGVS